MKYIIEIDDIWHTSSEELPPTSKKVEFMDKNGNIKKGGIVVDMSGHYCYSSDEGWGSFDNLVKWRFIRDNK